jgi:hypothetical protein
MESEIKLKRCSTCNESKPIDSFSNHKRTKDGKYYQCKDCKKLVCKNYSKSIVYKDYQKKYRQTENRKNYQKNYQKNYRKKYAEKYKEYNKEYQKTDKFKQYQQSEKYKNYKTSYDKKNEVKKARNIRTFKDRENLSDYYIRNNLKQKGYTPEQIKQHPEILEVQKLIIKTKRLCKTSQN